MVHYTRRRARRNAGAPYVKPTTLSEYDPEYFAVFETTNPVMGMLAVLIYQDFKADPDETRDNLNTALSQYSFLYANSEAIALFYKEKLLKLLSIMRENKQLRDGPAVNNVHSLDSLCFDLLRAPTASEGFKDYAARLISGDWNTVPKPLDL